jgi:hypothetical protein
LTAGNLNRPGKGRFSGFETAVARFADNLSMHSVSFSQAPALSGPAYSGQLSVKHRYRGIVATLVRFCLGKPHTHQREV